MHHRPSRRPARLLPLLAVLAPFAPTSSAAAATAARSARRRRRRRRPSASSRVATRLADTNSEEGLRQRWVEILSLDDRAASPVRLENGRERRYYYEAEVLADQLLGMDDAYNSHGAPSTLQRGFLRRGSLLSQELSILWKSIAVASSGLLIGIPLAALFGSILSSKLVQTFLSSVQSTVTPYLLPTLDVVSTSVRNSLLQAQAVVHSLPYFLRHLNRIQFRPLPFLYKLIRKCLIIEAWRHIWVRVYKLTRYLWRGTMHNAKAAYVKVCPAWIRRGVKSMFQSMVQAQVHGVVGGVVGSALSGVTFESWAGSSGDGGGGEESLYSMVEDSLGGESVSGLVSESAAQGMEAAVQVALESDVMADVVDAMSEGAETAAEEAVESIAEEVMGGLVEGVEEAAGASLDEVVEIALSD
ncbi:hypothetical protein ACHAXT_001851 [Thalassiosira profunda]